MWFRTSLYFLYWWFPFVTSEAFSSTANLVQLVKAEQALLADIEGYLTLQETTISMKQCQQSIDVDCARIHSKKIQLDEIRGYVSEMKKCLEVVLGRGALFYAGHPINAYRLVKRWNRLRNMTSHDVNLWGTYRRLPIPTENDVSGALASLLTLQRVYLMKTEDMILGKVLSETSVHCLMQEDCQELAEVALRTKDYGLAAQWGEECANFYGITNIPILHTLTEASIGIEDYKRALLYASEAIKKDVNNSISIRLYEECKRLERMYGANYVAPYTSITWERHLKDWHSQYEKLCRGEADALTDPDHTQDLVCRHKWSRVPYMAFKEEVLSWDPRISLFHEVISQKEADYVINTAYPKLNRATVGSIEESIVTDLRISKVAWLWDSDNPIVSKLSHRVSLATGLDTTFSYTLSNAEPFQVVNYGIGGNYQPHFDFSENDLLNDPDFLKGSGDRLSTFLYYLSDVRHGGATVFPEVNLRIPPLKYGAAFWYNAKLSGDFDRNTRHAGCPVLLGQKWVSNKWIRERGQVWKRPCGMTPHTIDKF